MPTRPPAADRPDAISRRSVIRGAAAGAAAAAGPRAAEAGPRPGAPALRIGGDLAPPAALQRLWQEAGGALAPGAEAADLLILSHDRAGAPDLPALTSLPPPASPSRFAALEADWRRGDAACWRAAGICALGLARAQGDASPPSLRFLTEGEGPVGGDPDMLLFALALALEDAGALPEGAAEGARADPALAEALARAAAALPPRPALAPAAALARRAPALCAGVEAAAIHAAGPPLRFDAPLEGAPTRVMGFAIPGGCAAREQATAFLALAAGAEPDWSAAASLMADEMLAELRPVPPMAPACRPILTAAAARLFPAG